MFIEDKTNYAFWLKKKCGNVTFRDIVDKATSFTDDFDDATNRELNEMLDRGVDIISTEFQMQKYIQRFGLWHKNKLMHAFENLSPDFYNLEEIEIIDYACGQGIGAFLYCEFLRERGLTQKVKKVTLIEPSKISLERAALHLQCISSETEISTINKYLGDLDEYDIINVTENSLHIFSNIIDVKSVDLFQLSNYVKSKLSIDSHFICVSPRNDSVGFTKRINEFCNYLEGDCYYHKDFWRSEWSGDCAMSLRIVRKRGCDSLSFLPNDESYINRLVEEELILNMITVESGAFRMGATYEQEKDAWDNEYPVHKVMINKAFRMTKYPITQKLWYAIMGNNPSVFKHPDAPVDSVSWDDCMKFIDALNQKFEFELSLPTEAQWEFAARGGNMSKNHKYAGGDDLDDIAWCAINTNLGTKPVGLKEPNELGFFDMSGNVWEWCMDWFNDYSPRNQEDPLFDIQTNLKVVRGGGWSSGKDYCRVSSRQGLKQLSNYNNIGLRLVDNFQH